MVCFNVFLSPNVPHSSCSNVFTTWWRKILNSCDNRRKRRKIEELKSERIILSNYNKKLVRNRQEMKRIHEKQFVILHSQIQRLKKKNIRLQKEHEEVTKYFKEKQGEILKLEYEIDGLHQDLQFSDFKQKFCGKNNFLDFSSQPRSM